MGGSNAESISATPPNDCMNITFELQQLDDLMIEHTRPPVTTMLGNKLHPLGEQMEKYIAAKEQDANDAAEIKSEFLKLKQEKSAVDAQLEKIKKEDTRFVDGLLSERGTNAGGKRLPVCPVCNIPVQIHKRMVNVMCSDSLCKWASDFPPENGRRILSRL